MAELEHIRDIVDGAAGRITARLDGLESSVSDQIRGTHARIGEVARRMETLEGRQTDQGKEIAKQGARLEGAEAGIAALTLPRLAGDAFPRAHKRAGDSVPVPHERSDDAKPITRRDVAVGVACSAAACAALVWVLNIAGKL